MGGITGFFWRREGAGGRVCLMWILALALGFSSFFFTRWLRACVPGFSFAFLFFFFFLLFKGTLYTSPLFPYRAVPCHALAGRTSNKPFFFFVEGRPRSEASFCHFYTSVLLRAVVLRRTSPLVFLFFLIRNGRKERKRRNIF